MSENYVEIQDWERYVMVFNKWDDGEWHFIDAPCIKGRFNFLHQRQLQVMFSKGIVDFCIEKIKEANPAPNKDVAEISFYCNFATAKDTLIIFKDSIRDKQISGIKSSGKVLYLNSN